MKTRFAVLAASCLCLSAQAADYLGAQSALERLAAAEGAPVAAEKKVSPLEKWRRAVKEYVSAEPGLEPAEAAKRWLALFDDWQKLTGLSMRGGGEDQPIHTLFAALPRPAAWDALVTGIAARPLLPKEGTDEKALRVLGAMLSGDHAKLRATVQELEKSIRPEFRLALEQSGTTSLSAWVAKLDGRPEEVVAAFEKQLGEAEKSGLAGGTRDIPDLVTLAGAEKAEALLRRTLQLRGMEINEVQGEATRALAVKLATELAPTASAAPWRLVNGFSRETIALFEALDRRFPRTAGGSEEMDRSVAEHWYLYALIAAGRAEDAAKFAAALAERPENERSYSNYETTEALVRGGYAAQVRAFFREALDKNPALPYWSIFITISARTGDAKDALAFLRAVAARPQLPEAAREKIDARLWEALLAADEVDEGVKLLRELLARKLEENKKPRPGASRRYDSFAYESDNEINEMTRRLGLLGRLLQKTEWVEESLRASREALDSTPPESMSYAFYSSLGELVETLLGLGRGPEAEELVLQEETRVLRQRKENPQQRYYLQPDQPLRMLVRIYQQAGRSDDVLKLLAEAKEWPAADLADLMGEVGVEKEPLGYLAASALAAKGRKDEARLVVEQLLLRQGGYDPTYELLLSLGGPDLIPKLDALAARDRFEERPLIWKAKLQFEAGQLAEAEKTVRAAITIDPSDGEQGKGSRMRAYAVLGDILEKKGDAAQAETMRGAVQAIRISENADDWWQAGLLSRAVKMYEVALDHFADAYCVQSRLALRYSELGDQDKAEEHYRRAYELMPTSFGRVESHCFGCEGVFNGKRAQGIADKVFTRLAETTPDKPQVYYLLGYLREAQGNYLEAAKQYRRAVELDPDYLNAWGKLAALSERVALPHAEIESAALAVLRLDPLQRHQNHGYSGEMGLGKFAEIGDLRKLWTELQRTVELQSAERDAFFPLAAAKAAREEQIKKAKAAMGEEEWAMRYEAMRYQRGERGHYVSASAALAQHTFFLLLQQMLLSE